MDSRLAQVKQIGMDVHKDFSRVAAWGEEGLLFQQRLEHRDREALRAELRRWPRGTPVVLEGTFGWSWMADELARCGLEPHLASGQKVDGWRKSRGLPKNNWMDAKLLAELMSQPKDHGKRWWEVWLAPREVREQRERLRYRMGLVQMQTASKNRMQAVLHCHGILHGCSDLFGKKGMTLLHELINKTDGRLPASAKATLSGSLKVLRVIRGELAQATRELRGSVVEDPRTRYWKSLPGVGWILASTIQAEVGPIERFKDSRSLAKYAMLAPKDDDSGEENTGQRPRGRHIAKAGRRTLKWALIQASYSAVRKSAHMREIFDRRTDHGKHDRNRGYIAVGHELCRNGYSCVKHRREFSEEAPPRPGTRRAEQSRDPHSEVGQPDVARIAAS